MNKNISSSEKDKDEKPFYPALIFDGHNINEPISGQIIIDIKDAGGVTVGNNVQVRFDARIAEITGNIPKLDTVKNVIMIKGFLNIIAGSLDSIKTQKIDDKNEKQG